MVQGGAYHELRAWLVHQPAADPLDFITRIQTAFDCERVTYLNGALTQGTFQIVGLYHVPGRERQRLARSLKEKRNLPEVVSLLSRLAPASADLAPLREKRRTPVEPDQVAAKRDVVYPLPHHPGCHACLIATPESRVADVDDWRQAHDHEIAHLAALFHAQFASAAKQESSTGVPSVQLTKRERETLAWIAAGKSYWETAMILGITERTVRYFMGNARRKLDVVNNAQAVAEAAWQGLIPRLAEAKEL